MNNYIDVKIKLPKEFDSLSVKEQVSHALSNYIEDKALKPGSVGIKINGKIWRKAVSSIPRRKIKKSKSNLKGRRCYYCKESIYNDRHKNIPTELLDSVCPDDTRDLYCGS